MQPPLAHACACEHGCLQLATVCGGTAAAALHCGSGEPCERLPHLSVSSPALADYMQKLTFLKNFWEGFREVLGSRHVIQTLDK